MYRFLRRYYSKNIRGTNRNWRLNLHRAAMIEKMDLKNYCQHLKVVPKKFETLSEAEKSMIRKHRKGIK